MSTGSAKQVCQAGRKSTEHRRVCGRVRTQRTVDGLVNVVADFDSPTSPRLLKIGVRVTNEIISSPLGRRY